MTLQQLKTKLNQLDPYDIVRAGLDSFTPYAYLDLPPDMDSDHLSDDEQEEWEEFKEQYLTKLRNR